MAAISKMYRINEVFCSLQGEGLRAGTLNIFIRFQGCNLRCDLEEGPASPGGFLCDTEFASGRRLTLDDLAGWVRDELLARDAGFLLDERDGMLCRMASVPEPWLVLTGGEPGLQVDEEFCTYWHARGWKLAIETNGTVALPLRADRMLMPVQDHPEAYLLDWITLSPKVAEHAVKQPCAHEIKYVRAYGQGIPQPKAKARHHLLSPAFDGEIPNRRNMEWCILLVTKNPTWRLSLQNHKFLGVR